LLTAVSVGNSKQLHHQRQNGYYSDGVLSPRWHRGCTMYA